MPARLVARLLGRFLLEDTGEDLIEYGLLAAFAASVVIGVLVANSTSLKSALSTAFARVVAAMSTF